MKPIYFFLNLQFNIDSKLIDDMREQKDYFEKATQQRNLGFKFVIGLTAFMIFSILAVRIYSLSTVQVILDPTFYVEPAWYNYAVIFLSAITLAMLYLTYKYKKIGVYGTALSIFLIVVINPEFSLLRTLAPMFTLFIFIGYGLFEIIPKWKFFK